jgi:hypothetical protein
MCCCLFSDAPLSEEEQAKHGDRNKGYRKYREFGTKFQTGMVDAPCSECPTSCCWFLGQFIPMTCGITQFCLRRKALGNDMSKYTCFQSQFTVCCCITGGSCGESTCPSLCLCLEAHLCNSCALSATRMMVMDQYDLQADPCDNRLIRFSNCMQWLSCFCWILAIVDNSFQDCAQIIDWIADVVYHTVSGCMTAQVATELNFRASNEGQVANGLASADMYNDVANTGYSK